MTRLASLAILALLPATLAAQWPEFKKPSAPRLPNGTVNMAAPAPRTADGKPDFSGVWDKGLLPGEAPPPGPFGGIAPSLAFRDLKNALGAEVPMLPWAATLKTERHAANSKDHPDAHCLPLHPIQLHLHPQPRKIIQTPDLLLILYEANDGKREIHLDGRPLPTNDPEPFWFGYSTGRWEDDTLVVESNGFKDRSWIDEWGTPGSDQLRLTERIRRPTYGTLQIQMTITDPKTFTKPFSFTVEHRLMPDTELIEFVCGENNTSAKRLVAY